MPVFGKGDPVVVEEDSDEEYWEYHNKKKKKEGSKGDSEKEGADGEKKEKKKKSEGGAAADPSFQFGWLNVVIIFGVGAICCIKLGLFDGENVPDFVAKRDDLEYYFKGLAAPEPANDTESDEKKGDEPDPFAEPESEEKQRF